MKDQQREGKGAKATCQRLLLLVFVNTLKTSKKSSNLLLVSTPISLSSSIIYMPVHIIINHQYQLNLYPSSITSLFSSLNPAGLCSTNALHRIAMVFQVSDGLPCLHLHPAGDHPHHRRVRRDRTQVPCAFVVIISNSHPGAFLLLSCSLPSHFSIRCQIFPTCLSKL